MFITLEQEDERAEIHSFHLNPEQVEFLRTNFPESGIRVEDEDGVDVTFHYEDGSSKSYRNVAKSYARQLFFAPRDSYVRMSVTETCEITYPKS